MRPADDVRSRGRAAWEAIQSRPIDLAYRNPWRSYAVALAVFTAVSAMIWSIGGAEATPALIGIGFFQLIALASLVSFKIGASLKPVRVRIAGDGVSLGCGDERLTVPWSSVDCERTYFPDQGKAVLPVEGLKGLRIDRPGSTDPTWWGEPLGSRLVQVSYSAASRWIEIRSSPPDFCERITQHLYPMLEVMQERGPEPADRTEGETVAEDVEEIVGTEA